MNKKLLLRFSVMILVVVAVAFAFNVYADATKARVASQAQGIQYVVGIGDISSGDTVNVDSSGNLMVSAVSGGNAQAVDATGNAAVEIKNDSNTMTVNSDGTASVKEITKHYVYKTADAVAIDRNNLGSNVQLHQIIWRANTAGDTLVIYDSNGANGTPEIDVSIATAKETLVINIPGGITFTVDVYVAMHNATGTAVTTSNLTLVYDY